MSELLCFQLVSGMHMQTTSEDELKAGYCVGHRTSSSVFKRKKKSNEVFEC